MSMGNGPAIGGRCRSERRSSVVALGAQPHARCRKCPQRRGEDEKRDQQEADYSGHHAKSYHDGQGSRPDQRAEHVPHESNILELRVYFREALAGDAARLHVAAAIV
jgi:hypothetical protein